MLHALRLKISPMLERAKAFGFFTAFSGSNLLHVEVSFPLA